MSPLPKKLILASRSPRRLELLGSLGLSFEVSPSQVDEHTDLEKTPEQNAVGIARDKARWVAGKNPGSYVLGADTLVVLGQEIIGQPADEEDAFAILTRLRGKQHRVITGMVLIAPDGQEEEAAVSSPVAIKNASDDEIRSYIATGEPMDKAGAYAIQGEGSFLVASWEGSYTNIVGLPLETLSGILERAGFPVQPHSEN